MDQEEKFRGEELKNQRHEQRMSEIGHNQPILKVFSNWSSALAASLDLN